VKHPLRLVNALTGLSGQRGYGTNASFRCTAKFGRYWRHSRHWPTLALIASVAIDPTATLAVHCGNGFDAGFSLYQSTRLSR
jgi:hypothetical protein